MRSESFANLALADAAATRAAWVAVLAPSQRPARIVRRRSLFSLFFKG